MPGDDGDVPPGSERDTLDSGTRDTDARDTETGDGSESGSDPASRSDDDRDATPQAASAHDAIVAFEYADERRARVVAESIAREVDEIADDRSRATIARDGSSVELAVRAGDLTALRAAINTWFALVDVAERTATVGDRFLANADSTASDARRSS